MNNPITCVRGGGCVIEFEGLAFGLACDRINFQRQSPNRAKSTLIECYCQGGLSRGYSIADRVILLIALLEASVIRGGVLSVAEGPRLRFEWYAKIY